MGRNSKIEQPAKNCTLRLPESFLKRIPEGREFGDWLRDMLPLNGNAELFDLKPVGITDEQKGAIGVFINLFNKLVDVGILDEYISDEIIEAAEIMEKID